MPTSKRVMQNKVRRLYEADPDLVLDVILEATGWPKILQPKTAYTRRDDAIREGGTITVMFNDFGDSSIDVISQTDPENPHSHRFISAFGDSGNPRVSHALRILAFAIARDNNEGHT